MNVMRAVSDPSSGRTRRLLLPAGTLVLTLAPRAAQACAVCFSGRTDETRVAFILTTALLTFLPFVLLGAAGWWLWRRVREHDEAQAGHRVRRRAAGDPGGVAAGRPALRA